MGAAAHVIVDAPASVDADSSSDPRTVAPPCLRDVIDHVEDLEARWSRFRDDSELSRLNARAGRPTVVSDETALLVQRSVWAWHATSGLFDPTVLDAVMDAGYDRSFESIETTGIVDSAGLTGRTQGGPTTIATHDPARRGWSTPGCEEVVVDPRTNLVVLPTGVRIDAGGIGKGLAADLTATQAVASGATSALVSLGGDLRVAGEPPVGGWEVEVDHHLADPARINLRAGALATSSVLRRRWATPRGTAHHTIDPRTGESSTGDAVAVSVVAGEAWWAEALSTAILVGYDTLGDRIEEMLRSAGALVTSTDGSQHTFGSAGHAFLTSSEAPPGIEPCDYTDGRHDTHGRASA